MADPNMTNRSMKQTSKKERTVVIILDSDDEDGNTAGSKQLTTVKNEQLTTSELAGDINTQIVSYGQSVDSTNQLPLQTSLQPSIEFERIMLQKRPDEERIQDLVVSPLQREQGHPRSIRSNRKNVRTSAYFLKHNVTYGDVSSGLKNEAIGNVNVVLGQQDKLIVLHIDNRTMMDNKDERARLC